MLEASTAPFDPVIVVTVTDPMYRYLFALSKTGLHGSTPGAVAERLIARELEDMLLTGVIE